MGAESIHLVDEMVPLNTSAMSTAKSFDLCDGYILSEYT